MPCQKQWKLCVIFQVASKAHFTVINLHLIPLDINDYLHATVVVGDRWWFRSRAGRAASSKGQERTIVVQRKENWARGNAWIHRSSKFRYKTLFLPPNSHECVESWGGDEEEDGTAMMAVRRNRDSDGSPFPPTPPPPRRQLLITVTLIDLKP